MAFIPGDGEKRGPLYEGLPTLEKHRNMRPLEAYLELVQECDVDKVLIGDSKREPRECTRNLECEWWDYSSAI